MAASSISIISSLGTGVSLYLRMLCLLLINSSNSMHISRVLLVVTCISYIREGLLCSLCSVTEFLLRINLNINTMRLSQTVRFLSLVGINLILLSWQFGLSASLEVAKISLGIIVSVFMSWILHSLGRELEDPVAWLLFLAVVYLGVGVFTTMLRPF